MPSRISPMLAVNDGSAAIEFYKTTFGAEFFLACEAPAYGTRGPSAAGFTTVRIELFVDDPVAVHRRALAAGAIDRSPVEEHEHSTTGPKPIRRMLQEQFSTPSATCG